jgi:hypothetical protein
MSGGSAPPFPPRKDLRFSPVHDLGTSDGTLNRDTLQFTRPLSTVIRTYDDEADAFSISHDLYVRAIGDFSQAEHLCIARAIERCCEVMPDGIRNRGEITSTECAITAADTELDVNVYLNVDFAAALARWTVASPDGDPAITERRFECWSCKRRLPYYHFDHSDGFYFLVSHFETEGQQCCRACAHTLTHMPPSSKAMVVRSRKIKHGGRPLGQSGSSFARRVQIKRATKGNRKPLPKAVRNNVWMKAFGHTFSRPCSTPWCENTITCFEFHVAHVQAVAKNGTNDMTNLVPVCACCNLSMSTMDALDWFALWEAHTKSRCIEPRPTGVGVRQEQASGEVDN